MGGIPQGEAEHVDYKSQYLTSMLLLTSLKAHHLYFQHTIKIPHPFPLAPLTVSNHVHSLYKRALIIPIRLCFKLSSEALAFLGLPSLEADDPSWSHVPFIFFLLQTEKVQTNVQESRRGEERSADVQLAEHSCRGVQRAQWR